MKHYSLIIVWIIFLLTGCASKTSFSVPFDEFTFNLYDNTKQYIPVSVETKPIGMKILTEMKQQTPEWYTGFTNSLIIARIPIQSWLNIKDLVDSNTKKNQLKLLKYKSTANENKNVSCNAAQYSWYITAFSYQLDTDTMYGGQYFFTDDEKLHIVSLNSDDIHDINAFVKSVKTIQCN